MPGAVFLEGESCKLKTFEQEYFDFYIDDFTHSEVLSKMLMNRPRSPKNMKERLKEEWLTDEDNIVLVVSHESEVAGYLFLRHEDKVEAEIGVLIREEFRRKGLGEESVSLLVDYAFEELGYHRVLARVLETNTASKNMLENLGFTVEGEEREKFFTKGEYKDITRMSLLKDEWRSK